MSSDVAHDLPPDLDPLVRPQDDLFAHVNGRWLETTEIPDDRAVHGTFHELRDQAEDHVREIISACAEQDPQPGSEARKIGDLYSSFMDVERLDGLGAQPIAPLLTQVSDVDDVEALMALLGRLRRFGVGGMLGSGIWIDRGDPDRYRLHVSQGGLGLPDESYYREERHADLRGDYQSHIAEMLHLCAAVPDRDAADAAAARVMGLETRIAAHHWERSDTRDAVRTYNVMSGSEIARRLRHSNVWLDAVGLPDAAEEGIVVGQPEVLDGLDALLVDVPLEDWRDWLRWRVVRATASYLSRAIDDARFAFYGTRLTGAPKQRDRWRRAVGLVEGALGEAVGRLYVERHYPPRAREQMERLVANLLEAYRTRISSLDWMEAETRERALQKLATFRAKIGCPDKWRDYSGLEIDPSDLVGNVWRTTAFELERDLDKLAGPVDRDEWFMTPQTVNAYYNPTMNEIVFPAAILQPPFFDPDVDRAYNYGGIGAVIGHEIGHGFDDQGSRYDGSGRLEDWWTPTDRERFEARANALVEQYDVLSPRDLDDSHTVNGKLTVGENIGDLGGVAVAHHAYRLSLQGDEAPIVDGLTGDQRFFVGWARVWRTLARPEEAQRRLAIDPHSPAEFRVGVVRNIDAFHHAFGTAAGDGLWLAPEERVRIW